mmetsp:Transcript_65723/g.114513  ORF Transcript_65723/g.114513 Transcript_65723/m.114513 type:complete len:243 (-) Transcript_65723:61-789(-)
MSSPAKRGTLAFSVRNMMSFAAWLSVGLCCFSRLTYSLFTMLAAVLHSLIAICMQHDGKRETSDQAQVVWMRDQATDRVRKLLKNRDEAIALAQQIARLAIEHRNPLLLKSAIKVVQLILKNHDDANNDDLKSAKVAFSDLEIDGYAVLSPPVPCMGPDAAGYHSNWVSNVYWGHVKPKPSNSVNQADEALIAAIRQGQPELLKMAIVVAHLILRTHDDEEMIFAWHCLSTLSMLSTSGAER